MSREYWGNNVDPEEDDAEYVAYPEDDKEDDMDPEDVDEIFDEIYNVVDAHGAAIVLDAVAEYMRVHMPKPFHRISKKITDIAGRVQRTEGAVEEGMQTRGIKT